MRYASLLFLGILLAGCVPPVPPVLPDAKPVAASSRSNVYTLALQDMNTLVAVYYPPTQRDIYYYVKPIVDSTNISATGEIPQDIADMVRAAFGDIHNKIRVLEHYTHSDLLHLEANKAQQQQIAGSERPLPNFVVSGSISMYDRGLESTSSSSKVMGSFGGGRGSVDLSGAMKDASGKSHIGVTLRVSEASGVSLPGRFGAEMDLWHAKDGLDIGFSIAGIGFGYATESTAVQGRHQALRLICDLSVVQIVGRTLGLPYWRVPLSRSEYQRIYEEDAGVIRSWSDEYAAKLNAALSRGPLYPGMTPLVASMQAACIANGDDSVTVNNRAEDPSFQASLQRFAQEYGVSNPVDAQYPPYPSFEMFKALEMNRMLDRTQAARAWAALEQFMATGGASSRATTARKAPSPSAKPASAASDPAGEKKPPKKTSDTGADYDKIFSNF
jgi:hypothetical protein